MDYRALADTLLEEFYHGTDLSHLPSIAKEGLTPNIKGKHGFNYRSKDLQDNSEGRVFLAKNIPHARNYALKDFTKPGVVLKINHNPSILHKDPIDDAAHFTTQDISPDKIDFFHKKTGFTPLSAHDPSLIHKLSRSDPDDMSATLDPDIDYAPSSGKSKYVPELSKGQLELFPRVLYMENIDAIVTSLLETPPFWSDINKDLSSKLGVNPDELFIWDDTHNNLEIVHTKEGRDTVVGKGKGLQSTYADALLRLQMRGNSKPKSSPPTQGSLF